MATFLDQNSLPDKKYLLEIVARKILRLTQDLKELDILDYSINKNAKRVTLSVGFKENIQTHQKFDLSSLFTFGNDNIGTEAYNGCHIRNSSYTPQAECQFSKDQDNSFEHTNGNTPVGKRPEFNTKLDPAETYDFSNTVPRKYPDSYSSINNDVHPIVNKTHHANDDDSHLETYLAILLSDDVDINDKMYINYLFARKNDNPECPITAKQIKEFMEEKLSGLKDNVLPTYREFKPGHLWLTEPEQKGRDVRTEMDHSRETSTVGHTAGVSQVVTDIINSARGIRGNLREPEITGEETDNGSKNSTEKEVSYNPDISPSKVDTKEDNTDTPRLPFRKFNNTCQEIPRKTMQKRKEEHQRLKEKIRTLKEGRDRKFQTSNIKKEDEDNKTEDLKIGSFDSKMYHY